MNTHSNSVGGIQRLNRRTFIKTSAMLATSSSALLAACGGSPASPTTSSTPTELLYTYTTFSGAPADLAAVQSAINATTAMKAKNLRIKLEPIDFAAYEQKLKLRFAAGTPGDAVFTASWVNNFYSNVAQGNFTVLDELLAKYAPRLAASMPATVFDTGRVNGKLYGIPNQQLFPKYWGVLIRKDLVQKYSIDMQSLHTYSDLNPILAMLKAKEPAITPILSDNQLGGGIYNTETFGVDSIAPGVGVKYDDTTLQAFNYFAQPEYMQAAQQAREWYQAGYYSKNPLSPSDAQAAFKAGKYAIVFDQARPEEPAKFKGIYGYDEEQALLMKPFLNTAAIVATLTAIPRSSQHPQQAMELLEILNTDKTVYNLICHGIAGKDYTLVDPAKGLINVPATSGYNPNTDWMFGNQFNGYYTLPFEADQDLWKISAQLNQQAARSVALGFAFDPTPVKTQVAQVTATMTQYEAPIEKGLVDSTKQIPVFLASLKAAGVDDIVQEAQKQLNAWKASKKS